MDQYDVSIIACEDYDEDRVENALRAALLPIGGLDFVKPGMTVGIKVNLVTAMKPESAATPHPAVVCALRGGSGDWGQPGRTLYRRLPEGRL